MTAIVLSKERNVVGSILVSSIHYNISHSASGIIPLVWNFRSGLKFALNFRPCFKEITLETVRKDAQIFGRIFFEKSQR